jgi:uncharacterized protein YdgA (DUF945 family)
VPREKLACCNYGPLIATKGMAEERRIGSVRITVSVLLVLALATVLVLPGIFSRSAEQRYRDVLSQLNEAGIPLRLESYQRGWFSSRATLSFPVGPSRMSLVQIVHHGPIVFYAGRHLAAPVAAVIETDPGILTAALNKLAGDAPLSVSTLIDFNGNLDTVIARPPSERDDPKTGVHVSVGQMRFESRSANGIRRLSRGLPSLWVRSGLGTLEITGIVTHGESHDFIRWLRVGASQFVVRRIAFNGSLPGQSFALNDLALDYAAGVTAGMLAVREQLSLAEFTNRTLKLGPLTLAIDLGHIAVQPIQDYARTWQAIARSSTPDANALNPAAINLLMQIIRQAPTLTLALELKSAAGSLAGQAQMGVDPALADDPRMTSLGPAPQGQERAAYLRDHYGWLSGQLAAPRPLLTALLGADRLKQLEDDRRLMRAGDLNEVARVSFKAGNLTLNGVKVALPSIPAPAVRISPATAPD